MTEQSAQSRQQPASYPSPTSYPSPSMQPSYTYPPPQGQSASDPYRASPPGQNMPQGSINLPPIRAIDAQPQQQQQQPQAQQHQHQQQQQQQQQQQLPPPQQHQQQQQQQQHQHQQLTPPHPQHLGTSLPPPPPPPPVQPSGGASYYGQPGQPMHPAGHQMNVASPPHHMGMRYPLPAQGADQRIMSGGRHKKEIKRRTKTGCLTCRKRRIKCDEAHPTCRNCQKSKRECLGYDPIFKQQPGPSQIQPAHIQPAPSAAPSASSVPAPSVAAPPVDYSAGVPQGYAPAASAGYPPPLPPPPSLASGVKHESATGYDYNSAIDPALAGAEPPGMSVPQAPAPYPPSMGPDTQTVKAKRVKVEELFSLNGIPPPPVPQNSSPVSPHVLEEVKALYARDYAPALDRLLETQWYTAKGLGVLLNDAARLEMFAYLVEQFRTIRSENHEAMRRLPSLEAKVVWHMLTLARTARDQPPTPNGTNGTSSASPPQQQPPQQPQQQQHAAAAAAAAAAADSDDHGTLKEARARLDIFESLITGEPLSPNPAAALTYPPLPPDSAKRVEADFWSHLGTFAARREESPAHDPRNRDADAALAQMRTILHQLETRDVIYSVAVVRQLGGRVELDGVARRQRNQGGGGGGGGGGEGERPGEHEDRGKLLVAKQFLEDEAQAAMSQVTARVAGMAVRSWTIR